VSFGAVPSASGQSRSFAVTVSNLANSSRTVSVAVTSGSGGVSYSVTPSTLSLGGRESGTVTVTMTAAKSAAVGDHQATLSLTGQGVAAHAAVYTLVK
jgi:uncharacterized membrane protein